MASLSAVKGVFAQRNARIFYSGSVVCWTGSWVQRIATDWLAWQLTHSVMWVAVIAFCNLVPSVVISPIAGAVADRMDRVYLTMASQFVAASQAAILVILVLTGTIRIEFMAVLTFCNGAAETFAQPARQCIIPGLVPRQFLPGAGAACRDHRAPDHRVPGAGRRFGDLPVGRVRSARECPVFRRRCRRAVPQCHGDRHPRRWRAGGGGAVPVSGELDDPALDVAAACGSRGLA